MIAGRWVVSAALVLGFLVGLSVRVPITGTALTDRVWCGLAAALLVAAVARASDLVALWFAAIAVAISLISFWTIPAAGALLLALWSVRRGREQVRGAAIGVLGTAALLHPADSDHRALVVGAVLLACTPVLLSGLRSLSRSGRRRVVLVGAVFAGTMVIGAGALALAASSARGPAGRGITQARDAADATRATRFDAAAAGFADAEASFNAARSAVDAPWLSPVLALPVLGANLGAVRTGLDAGVELASAAQATASAAPYDKIHLVNGRVDLGEIDAMVAPVAALERSVDHVAAALSALDRTWLLGPVRSRVSELTTQIDAAAPQVATASLAVDQLPSILGQGGRRTYLVAFTSEAEARFLGGFVGSYGLLTADDGALHFEGGAGGVSALNSSLGPDVPFVATPEFRSRYARFRMQEFAQNWTAAPDLPSDAAVMEQLYAHATGVHVDGVLTIDPAGIAALLRITGPIKVNGIKALNADNVVEYLLHGQYVQFGLDPTGRRDVLTEIARTAFDELLRSPATTYHDLSRAFGPAVEDGHIMFTVFDPRSEELLDRVGVTGRFDPHPADLLFSLRNSDSLANKIDYFLHRSTTYDATIDPRTGHIEADVTIVLRNDAPSSGLPPYIIGTGELAPRGDSGSYVSLYTSLGVTETSIDGERVLFQGESEYGVLVLSRGVIIPSKGSRTIRMHLRGSVPIDGGQFTMSLPHQPVVNADPFTLTIRSTDPSRPIRSITGPGREQQVDADGSVTVSGDQTSNQHLTIRTG